ncbi:MAG: hypothetical protein ABIC57_04135, partial [bacterium]
MKKRELNTDVFARELAIQLDAHIIVSTRVQEDPNWEQKSELRKYVESYAKENGISLVLDIHGRDID